MGSFNPGALLLISGRTIMVGFGPPASRQARREWWRRQIQRQKEGSLSVAEFCRCLGVSTVTFYAWKRRFREAPPAFPPRS
jgi:transposase-like protein